MTEHHTPTDPLIRITKQIDAIQEYAETLGEIYRATRNSLIREGLPTDLAEDIAKQQTLEAVKKSPLNDHQKGKAGHN